MSDVYGLFNGFLESAASLAVLFIIVAWVSSKVVELIQLSANMHGRVLRSELERCFGEDRADDPNRGRFTRYFYWHPMIVPLTQPSRLVSGWRWLRSALPIRAANGKAPDPRYPPGRLPAHIAPESFTAVVMNPFPWPTTQEPLRRMLSANLIRPVTSTEIDTAVETLLALHRALEPGETWRELTHSAGVDPDFPLEDAFLDSRVEPRGVATAAELLWRRLRANLQVAGSISDDRLRRLADRLVAEADSVVFGETWQDVLNMVAPGSPSFFSSAFMAKAADVPSDGGATAQADPLELYAEICRRNRLVPDPFETRIAALLRDADGDMDAFRAGLNRWYAEAMDRVTGRFKRGALMMLFAIALLIGTAFNLNALTILDGLIGNPELRGLGVQASRAIGDSPRGMAGLSQKVQFRRFAQECAPDEPKATNPPCDEGKALAGLWLDHGRPMIFSNDVEFAPIEPEQTAAMTKDQLAALVFERRRGQVVKVLRSCDTQGGLCSPTLSGLLHRCTGAEWSNESCARAWSAIWKNPDFFWQPEAAHTLALHRWGGARLDPKQTRELVRDLGTQAEADTAAIEKYIRMLPSIGWIGDHLDDVEKRPWWSIFGILITAALAALGAPFWYDVLGKISGRGAGGTRGEKA